MISKIYNRYRYSLDVIVFYFMFESVNVPNSDKTPGDFAFGVLAK